MMASSRRRPIEIANCDVVQEVGGAVQHALGTSVMGGMIAA
jgi:hypothetical protein